MIMLPTLIIYLKIFLHTVTPVVLFLYLPDFNTVLKQLANSFNGI